MVRGFGLSCAWGAVYAYELGVEDSCEGTSNTDSSMFSLPCEISVGLVVGRDVLVTALCLG